jgi:hypothetical protein
VRRDALVAQKSRDLLDQVFLDLEVEAIAGRGVLLCGDAFRRICVMFGMLPTAFTSATTTPLKGGATGFDDATSGPLIVSRCASSSLPIGGFE